MARLPVLKPREIAHVLEKMGFVEVRQRGSHKQYRHVHARILIRLDRTDGSRSQRHPREDGAMVEASAAVLEASTTASRANSLGKTDPHRMGRANKARRKLTPKAIWDYADSTIAEIVTAH